MNKKKRKEIRLKMHEGDKKSLYAENGPSERPRTREDDIIYGRKMVSLREACASRSRCLDAEMVCA